MKRLSLFLVPFLVFADGEEITEQQFNSWKSIAIQEINNAKSNIRLADNDLAYVQNRYISMSQSAATFTGDYGNGYRAALSEFPIGSVSSARSDLGYAQDKLDSALMYLNRLQFSNSSNIDYRVWLDRMTNQLERIADLVDLTDDDVRTNGVYLSSAVQILQSILDSMPSGSGGSGGGGSDPIDYSDDLASIISILGSASTTLEVIDSTVYSLYVLFSDIDGEYQKFLRLATDRLKTPDQYLAIDLARMWEYTVNNMSNVIVNSSAFSDTDQINPVMNNVSADGTHLSNEGEIMLNQLAFQQRQYLCTVEALNILRGNTNGSDVAWITNYLDKVQSPFYRLFDNYLPVNLANNPYAVSPYNAFTNFIDYASTRSSTFLMLNKYANFRNLETNWFSRVEMYLLNLQGLIGSQGEISDDSVETMQDSENIERTNEYSTNSLYAAVSEIASVSNSLSAVVSSFQDFIGSFHFEDTPSASSGYIRIMPDFVLGGIEIPHIDLTYQDIDFLVDGTRTIFTAIWYFVFGALGFKFICLAVFLFGRTVARVSLIIATLLN